MSCHQSSKIRCVNLRLRCDVECIWARITTSAVLVLAEGREQSVVTVWDTYNINKSLMKILKSDWYFEYAVDRRRHHHHRQTSSRHTYCGNPSNITTLLVSACWGMLIFWVDRTSWNFSPNEPLSGMINTNFVFIIRFKFILDNIFLCFSREVIENLVELSKADGMIKSSERGTSCMLSLPMRR